MREELATRRTGVRREARALLARRGRAWDAEEVARHLMACRGQIVNGLRSKTPWAGLDGDTLDSCYGHGAAVVVRVAVSGQRPEWRRPKDLERAQVAAFRHQALDHWKRVNTQSRRGDRLAVAFDPERHAAPDAPMDRLFEQPDLHAVQRDLLAELDAPGLRAFWAAVFAAETPSFKLAGDALGLSKAQVMAHTRAGRAAFGAYLMRRESGELCSERGRDIVALRAGDAQAIQAERAEAHLESCYACSLVHDAGASAFQRGILGAAPIGVLLRWLDRAAEVASVPATRWADVGAGGRIVAAGVAAVTVAGAGAGLQAATTEDSPAARPPARAARPAQAVVAAPEPFRTPATLLRTAPATSAPATSAAPASAAARPARRTRAAPTRRARTTTTTAGAPTPAPTPAPAPAPSSAPAVGEFSFERGSRPAPAPAPVPRPSPAAQEFPGP